MIADEQNPRPCIGTPEAKLLEADAFHHAVVGLIEKELPVWRDRPKRPPFEDEPSLNQSLCVHLNQATRRQHLDSIEFLQEPIQSSSRRADIAVMTPGTITVQGRDYEDFVQLLPIECKRLPTPRDKRRSDCEYVHGVQGHRTGAIERFKHGLHGPTNERAMIIGYVQDQTFVHWQTTINTRIKKLADEGSVDGLWEHLDMLSESRDAMAYGLQKLTSEHRRLKPPASSISILIDHLWLLMN